MICPLHGFVWRKSIKDIVSKYALWSSYEPEEYGVMIAYASVYGNTENAAEILSCRLRDNGIKTVMFDVSVTPASEIVAAAFRWSHLVFASTTYNAGIFVTMEALINGLAAHNIQNRTAAVIENGSWAATSGNLICDILKKCKNINVIENKISIKSSLKTEQLPEIDSMANAIAATFPNSAEALAKYDRDDQAIQAFVLSDAPSVSYQYYFDHIKPKPQAQKEKRKGSYAKYAGMYMNAKPCRRISFVLCASMARQILNRAKEVLVK